MTAPPSSGDPWLSLPRLDSYDLRARVLPALLVAAPALALAVALPFGLHGAHRLWSLVGLAVWPLAAALMRTFGNAVQPGLWNSWGGAPTTVRLRWATGPGSVIAARHQEARDVLGDRVTLPNAVAEGRDPQGADAIYADVARRLFGLTRGDHRFPLLHRENANYGFARNLYGARRFALSIAFGSLAAAAATGTFLAVTRNPSAAVPLLLPALVSVVALVVWWRAVTPALVRPPADSLADQLLAALQALAADRRRA